jgi:hypothetical protein
VIPRIALGAVLVAVMLVVGPATYVYLGSRTSKAVAPPAKPTAATPRAQAFSLPGTLYIAQDGALYSLSAGRFHQLTNEDGWTQPSLMPDGNLLAVRRQAFYSDLYVLNSFGYATRRVTNNSAPNKNSDPGLNHWVFYPKLSADGRTIWLAYDKPKYGYDVVMSIWAMPANGTISQGRLWTNAADYAGGDVQPVPVKGGVIYTKYDFASRYDPNEDAKLAGMLWFTNRAYSYGKQLTPPGDDCRSPSVSPDGTQIAMICTYQKQVSYLEIASWDGAHLGKRKVVIDQQLVAQPTWAPDGSGIAYLAPGAGSGPFQLWFAPRDIYAPVARPSPTPTPGGPHNGPYPTPSPSPVVVPKPIQITTNNGFDATSPLAWR